jgi:LysM repeat protein
MRIWKSGIALILAVGFLCGALAAWASLGEAAGQGQGPNFVTPTPGPDGRIIYIVKENDALWTIAALSGKTVEELMALNGLQPNDFLVPGMQLVLGVAGPAQPTAGAQAPASPTPAPTATPIYGTGEICVLLFVDQNGDARLQAGEPPLAGGKVSLADRSGSVAADYTTTAEYNADGEPADHCFDGLENGDYSISAAVPTGYNPTTSMNLPVRLAPGDIQYVEFGAQASAAIGGGADGSAGGRSVILGVVGVLLLAIAGALGYMATRYGRSSRSNLRS